MKKQRSITSEELKIDTLHLVMHSMMKKGHTDSPSSGRYSDCFVYVLDGTAKYTFGSNRLVVQEGNILYLPYRSVYSIDVLTPVFKVLYVDFSFSQNEDFDNSPELFDIAKSLTVENTFRKLHKKWIMHQFGSSTECFSLLYEIYAKILKNFSTYIPSAKYNSLKSAIDYILLNYTDNTLSLSKIVMRTSLSEGHFRRLFKEVYRVSPIEYIINLRLEHAKNLLLNTDLTISDISEFSGFSGTAYFCLQFKKKLGYTPTEFRNQCR